MIHYSDNFMILNQRGLDEALEGSQQFPFQSLGNTYTTKPHGKNLLTRLANVSLSLSGKFSKIDQVVKYIKRRSPALRSDDFSNASLKVLIKGWKRVRLQAFGHEALCFSALLSDVVHQNTKRFTRALCHR